MSRKTLSLGASVLTLTLACASYAEAQQNLPTINVGGANKTTRVAPPRSRPTGAGQMTNADPVTGTGGDATQGTKVTLGEQLDPDAPKSIWSPTTSDGKSAYVEKWQIPNTVASITRKQIETKINIVDPQDAIKYMPSLFVRKRNEGDQYSVLQTRTWGVNSAARSLVYADDLLLSPLLQNNNSGIASAPRWNMVAPEEIERVDVMYGPYSAQYPGNSMGAVVKYTTRMPEKLTATAKNITEVQDYSQFGTTRGYTNNITQIFIGDKVNDFMWNVSGNWQHGSQQPLSFVTATALPNGFGGTMTGAQYATYPSAINTMTKFGQPAVMYGSTGNLAVDQVQGKAKAAYDISTTTRASYTFGYFSNDSSSSVQNYMFGNSGNYFFGRPNSSNPAQPGTAPARPLSSALTTFGQGVYRIQEKLMTNAGAIKSNSGGMFDYELSASNFTYLQSNQSNPYSMAYPYGGVTEPGRVQKGGGTYWTDVDANGILRPDGILKAHTVTFGLHGDQHHLNNPVYYTTQWTQGEQSAYGMVQTVAQGTTRTKALWVQDAIKINDATKFTVGIRGQNWIASDGINQISNPNLIASTGYPAIGTNTQKYIGPTMPNYQPTLYHTRFSPKGSLEYLIDDKWKVVGNIGMANRFPTVGELYNLSLASGQINNTVPNPYLSPEVALTKEINFERSLGEGQTGRITLFDEEVRDALVQQTTQALQGDVVTFSNQWTNIKRIRNSGVEIAFNKNDVAIKGLEVTGSATWVNSRIINDPTWSPTTLPTNPFGGNLDSWCWNVSGKNMPYVPEWRGTLVGTYRPDTNWAFTVAGRYQSKVYSTLSNNDKEQNVFGGFDGFFVMDLKTTYKVTDHLQADFGINNLNNYHYIMFHPFPQRTFYGSLKYELGTIKKDEPGIFYLGRANGLPETSSWFQPAEFTID